VSKLIINFHREQLPKLKQLISVLGGKTRIEILKRINDGKDWTISKLAKTMDCGVANLSQQVTELEKAGLVLRKTAKSIGTNMKIITPVYKYIEIIFQENDSL